MQIGEQIRRLRKKQHLTQKSLADKLFVTPQSVSQWERGATVPDADRLPEIVDAIFVIKYHMRSVLESLKSMITKENVI